MPATRQGKVALSFGTLTIYTSELIELKYQQKMSVSEIPTIQNTTLSQPGALSLFEIQVRAKITGTTMTVLGNLHSAFASRSMLTLGGVGMNYGSCYLSGFEYTITELDEAQKVLNLEVDLTFTQSNESYSAVLLSVATSSDEVIPSDLEEIFITP